MIMYLNCRWRFIVQGVQHIIFSGRKKEKKMLFYAHFYSTTQISNFNEQCIYHIVFQDSTFKSIAGLEN